PLKAARRAASQERKLVEQDRGSGEVGGEHGLLRCVSVPRETGANELEEVPDDAVLGIAPGNGRAERQLALDTLHRTSPVDEKIRERPNQHPQTLDLDAEEP